MKCWCVHAAKGGAMAMPLSSPFAPTTILRSSLWHRALLLPFPPCAVSSSKDTAEAAADQEGPATTKTATVDNDFEEHVLRIKSHTGPRKRGARKKKAKASANVVTLLPVALWEPRSALGVPVEFSFTTYSERLNGALAVLVELGSGQALVKYHQPATLFLQAYTIAAAAVPSSFLPAACFA
ncbi:uncharacterized protein [Setaria viridis]|uniref:uncharacterized protein n=1 Tax=Setaria viridis TaxID=4556 RepID=UPI003B3A6915